ncbi:MAG: hypothetical protein HZB51_20270 [Chloroflexi bacterium]|nr:hypothetical protein [Chloroflexota bacterium]
MSSFSFWQKWLVGAGLVMVVFGILMALVSGTVAFDWFNRQIDPVFWGTNAVGVAAKQFQRWIYAVLGATMAGWGVFLTYLARYPFNKKEQWAWNCLFFGLLVWFVVDTSFSIFYKVYFNAASNTAFLILVGLSVVFTRKEFA